MDNSSIFDFTGAQFCPSQAYPQDQENSNQYCAEDSLPQLYVEDYSNQPGEYLPASFSQHPEAENLSFDPSQDEVRQQLPMEGVPNLILNTRQALDEPESSNQTSPSPQGSKIIERETHLFKAIELLRQSMDILSQIPQGSTSHKMDQHMNETKQFLQCCNPGHSSPRSFSQYDHFDDTTQPPIPNSTFTARETDQNAMTDTVSALSDTCEDSFEIRSMDGSIATAATTSVSETFFIYNHAAPRKGRSHGKQDRRTKPISSPNPENRSLQPNQAKNICEDCNASFMRKDDLNKHIKTHHFTAVVYISMAPDKLDKPSNDRAFARKDKIESSLKRSRIRGQKYLTVPNCGRALAWSCSICNSPDCYTWDYYLRHLSGHYSSNYVLTEWDPDVNVNRIGFEMSLPEWQLKLIQNQNLIGRTEFCVRCQADLQENEAQSDNNVLVCKSCQLDVQTLLEKYQKEISRKPKPVRRKQKEHRREFSNQQSPLSLNTLSPSTITGSSFSRSFDEVDMVRDPSNMSNQSYPSEFSPAQSLPPTWSDNVYFSGFHLSGN
ncbi:MAG: hypothetical protein M1834_009160 [Cirrosporium novae-zelandiae]|nr:MAG: hypothetical protein M1834_009160 [Cirrosporium novae-zelandiae]